MDRWINGWINGSMVARSLPGAFVDAPGTSSVVPLSPKRHILLSWGLLRTDVCIHPPELIPTSKALTVKLGGGSKKTLRHQPPRKIKSSERLHFEDHPWRPPFLMSRACCNKGLLLFALQARMQHEWVCRVWPRACNTVCILMVFNPTTHPGAIKGFPRGAHKPFLIEHAALQWCSRSGFMK